MIRPIDIRLNAAHPDLPLAEAVTYTGAPSTVLIRGVPGNCGRWAITAVFVAATFPDGSTSTRTAVQSANGVWVATLPATATSGRTAHGLRILADGADENGEAVSGYVLGVADFAVASLAVTPAPEPGETSWQMLYFDAAPGVLRKGDVTKIDGVLKLYNGTAWEAFASVPAASTATPAMDGTGSAGSSAAFARSDHVHPTDTSRMAATATGSNIPASTGGALTIEQSLEANANAIGSIGNLAEQTAQGLSTHTGNTTIHVTSTEKATWNGKQSALTAQQLANIAAVPDKLDKSGGTMTGPLSAPQVNITRLGYSTWSIELDGDVGHFHFKAPRMGEGFGSVDLILPRRSDNLSGTIALTAANPTAGNLAALDANGNPVDAGMKASDKLDSTSAAPAFSSDSSVQYPVDSHVTYNGKIYKCTTATTGGTWVAGSWTADTMTDPDAVLDITAQNQLRVVAKDGTPLWAQGYDLASTSSATLACDATNNFTFADGATTQAFTLPTAPTGKVGDFGLDIDNSANASAATMTLTGLDTAFSVVVPKGESLNDMLAIAAGELAQFYVTLTTFRVNNLPTWHILKQVVENGGAQS